MDSQLRQRLDNLTEPYPRQGPGPALRFILQIPGAIALLFILFIVWRPIILLFRFVLGL